MSTYRDNLARPLPKQQETTQYAPKNVPKRTPEGKGQVREKLLWLATILFCIVVTLVLVANHADMVSLNYSVEKQKIKLQEERDKSLKAEQEVLELESPERIKSYAANKLGMRQAGNKNLVIVPGSAD